jgi:hypothetical protein
MADIHLFEARRFLDSTVCNLHPETGTLSALAGLRLGEAIEKSRCEQTR